ncbi:MAG TPA: inositol monophosphatase [Flavobacteriales bacterium]|nr:inositol monophosphatase [Flavobacteriales bacterium]
MNIESLSDNLNEIILEAAALMPGQISEETAIITKDKNSLVTEVDKNIEEFLVNALSKLIPNAGFIAEEGTAVNLGNEYNWIIDPLDGTTNFIHGIPAYCISVGLKKGNEIVLGSVFEFIRENYYTAIHGGGSYMNGTQIHVSKTKKLDDALLATGFPYYDFRFIEQYIEVFKDFMKLSRGIRRLGSAALDMAYVASGKFDGFFEYSLHPWDVAAGVILVREAGGTVTDFGNGNNFLFGKEMLASNSLIHTELINIIGMHFR